MTFLDTKRAYDIALGVAFISPHSADIGERRETDLGKQFPSALGSTAIIKRPRVLRLLFSRSFLLLLIEEPGLPRHRRGSFEI